MRNTTEKLNSIKYEYLFPYYGEKLFNGNIVTSLGIELEITPYKNTYKKAKLWWLQKIAVGGLCLSDCATVYTNMEFGYTIIPKPDIIRKFCNKYKWSHIIIRVKRQFINIPVVYHRQSQVCREYLDDISCDIQSCKIRESIQVTEHEFIDFLISDIHYFKYASQKYKTYIDRRRPEECQKIKIYY